MSRQSVLPAFAVDQVLANKWVGCLVVVTEPVGNPTEPASPCEKAGLRYCFHSGMYVPTCCCSYMRSESAFCCDAPGIATQIEVQGLSRVKNCSHTLEECANNSHGNHVPTLQAITITSVPICANWIITRFMSQQQHVWCCSGPVTYLEHQVVLMAFQSLI